MRKEINDLLRESLLTRDEEMMAYDFGEIVTVVHQDGSNFEFKCAKHERQKLLGFDLIIVFTEHNTVNVFTEVDLVSVSIKPRSGGRARKLKLQKTVDRIKL